MKKYGVKEVSKLSGVSVRTLHHYDKIGLLKPLFRSEAGYRYYGDEELLRLQQILFYKELDFPLKVIQSFLDEPDFDPIDTLKKHKLALIEHQSQISTLLVTIDKTINHLKKGKIMKNPEMLYEGLPKEMGTSYRKEAVDKYGKSTIENTEKELLKIGKKGFDELKSELNEVTNDLFSIMMKPPDCEQVQSLVRRHYEIIRKFWGSSKSSDKQADAYAGLGKLYVSDERFTIISGEPQPEFAQFLEKAMKNFSETQLK